MKVERGEIYKWTNANDTEIWGLYEVVEPSDVDGICSLKILNGSGRIEVGKTFRYPTSAFIEGEWVSLQKKKLDKPEDTSSERETLEI